MPARQTTVVTSARRPPKTKARAAIARPASHQGDSASSDCIGLRKPVADLVLERARRRPPTRSTKPPIALVGGVGDPLPDGVRRELGQAQLAPRQEDRDQGGHTRDRRGRSGAARTLPPPPRATFSERSLAAVVVRSSITAITTISTPGTKLPPKSLATQRVEDGLPEARAVDVRRDGGHRQRRQRGLVETDDDGLAGHRELHLEQPLPVGLAGRVGGLDRRGGHLADAEAGDPHERRDGVDEGRDDGAADPDAEEEHDRHEVDEGRHRLHEVEDDRDHLVGARRWSRPGRRAAARRGA